MKKNTRLSFILITLSAFALTFTACNNKQASSDAQNAQGTTKPQASQDTSQKSAPKDKNGVGAGTGSWTVGIIVNDQTQKPIAGATVSAPCTGWPSKTTNSSGQVQFSGTGSCPCSLLFYPLSL